MDYYHQCYLQVIDMLFSVQVDATGPLLDGHNWEADVDAAMKFPFLDLKTMTELCMYIYLHIFVIHTIFLL